MKVIIELNDIILESIPDNNDEIIITTRNNDNFGQVVIEDLKLAIRKLTAK